MNQSQETPDQLKTSAKYKLEAMEYNDMDQYDALQLRGAVRMLFHLDLVDRNTYTRIMNFTTAAL